MQQPRILMSQTILSQEQLAALGTVVAESTYLETFVDLMIGALTGLKEDKRRLLLDKAMLQAKLEILAELGAMKLKSKRRKKTFAKLIAELKANNAERVTAVHGIWLPNITADALPEQLKQLLTPGSAVARHPRGPRMSATTLTKLAEKISNGKWDLVDFHTKVWATPAARRRVLRARLKPLLRRLVPRGERRGGQVLK